ncbi:MAG: hypothetical protein KF752_04945 [Pirellulaceae bacterium]|nr:hypothetical protein [Pirellulaceae bacterium]
MSLSLTTLRSTTPRQLEFAWTDLDSSWQADQRVPVNPRPRLPVHIVRKQPFAKAATTSSASQAKTRQPVQLDRSVRIGQARMGTLMLNLLRSYGITEEEIALGIANYAGDA